MLKEDLLCGGYAVHALAGNPVHAAPLDLWGVTQVFTRAFLPRTPCQWT